MDDTSSTELIRVFVIRVRMCKHINMNEIAYNYYSKPT